MALPTPVLSNDDILEVQSSSYESARLIWNTWSQDPIKAAVLHTVLSCQSRLRHYRKDFCGVISMALGQNRVCFLHYSSLGVEEAHYLNVFRMHPKSRSFSLSWVHILTPGGHLLAISIYNRKTVPRLCQLNVMHGPSGASCVDRLGVAQKGEEP